LKEKKMQIKIMDKIDYLKNNIDSINEKFKIELSLKTPESITNAVNCIEVYDTRDDIQEVFDNYDHNPYTFEMLCEEGWAAKINNKFIWFNEFMYNLDKAI
jgi:hypothetical protein